VLGIFDSVIIVISLALVVGAVLRAAGKKETDAEYFLAGRDLRWPFSKAFAWRSHCAQEVRAPKKSECRRSQSAEYL